MALDKGKRRLLEKEVTQEGTVYKMTVRDIVMKDFGDVSTIQIVFCFTFLNFVQIGVLKDICLKWKGFTATGHFLVRKKAV